MAYQAPVIINALPYAELSRAWEVESRRVAFKREEEIVVLARAFLREEFVQLPLR